jgi:uncharacterized membrane protein (DUF441 family)
MQLGSSAPALFAGMMILVIGYLNPSRSGELKTAAIISHFLLGFFRINTSYG